MDSLIGKPIYKCTRPKSSKVRDNILPIKKKGCLYEFTGQCALIYNNSNSNYRISVL